MENYILNTDFFWDFDKCAKKAKEIAQNIEPNVEFDFNGIKVIVGKETNLDLIWRDYLNAYKLDWEEVGPNCTEKYSSDIEKALRLEQVKQDEILAKYRKEQEKQTLGVKEKIKDIELDVVNSEKMKEWEDNNKDGYGGAIISYAKRWGQLMQYEISQGHTLKEVAEKASHEADIEGITCFMYGAAVQVLADTWKYGEELRKWHNKEYNHEGDGVVNPAIISI